MKQYSGKISLVKNSRGIYCLDTTMGCSSGMAETINGCYGDCYAAKSAKTYGFDFSKTVLRSFENEAHRKETIKQINNSKLEFIRIGCSGDPSENWEHTISILDKIKNCNKEIVIITKHWVNLTQQQIEFFSSVNVCFNTSVSALDKPERLQNSIEQHSRIKPFCKSILRAVSCNFNLENKEGKRLAKIQDNIFKHGNILDTVFRPNKNNRLVTDGIINVSNGVFNSNKQLMSKFNRKTYTGKCSSCKEMCGARMGEFEHKIPLTKQIKLF
jgi:hypothetical protein